MENTYSVRAVFSMGIAAAAATVAAVRFLFGKDCSHSVIKIHGKEDIAIPVTGCRRTARGAEAWVTRDGGDDPDVTNGVVIASSVEISDKPGITVLGGKGVGVVTTPGMLVPPGRAAINPGPMSVIRRSLESELPQGKGAMVIISIPSGEELAKRTYNPRLGIVGGLSILDASWVTLQTSSDSSISEIKRSMSGLESSGARSVCLVPGNYGHRMAMIIGVPDKMIVNTGNYAAETLAIAGNLGFEKVLIVGQIGRLVKFSAGSYDTHGSHGGGRLEAIAAYSALHGATSKDVREILESSMPDELAVRISKTYWGLAALQELVQRVMKTAKEIATGITDCAVLTFSLPDRELARTLDVDTLVGSLKEDLAKSPGSRRTK